MKNNKGFTLVEVLAVIVLLGLIAAILVPNYNKSIEKSRQNAFKETLNGLTRSIENYLASNSSKDYLYSYTDILTLDIEANNLNQIKSGKFMIKDGSILLKDIYNGTYCGNGSKNNYVIKKGSC